MTSKILCIVQKQGKETRKLFALYFVRGWLKLRLLSKLKAYWKTRKILLLLACSLLCFSLPVTVQAQYQISNEQLTQQEQMCDLLLLKLNSLKLSMQTSNSDLTEVSKSLTISRQEIQTLKTELQLSRNDTMQMQERLMTVSALLSDCESKLDKLEKQAKAEQRNRKIERAGWITLTAYLLFVK